MAWVIGTCSSLSLLYTGASGGSERGCELPMDTQQRNCAIRRRNPAWPILEAWALSVVTPGICEPPARLLPLLHCPHIEVWALAVPGFELLTRGAEADEDSGSAQHHVIGQLAALGPVLWAFSLMWAFSSICLSLESLPSSPTESLCFPYLPREPQPTALGRGGGATPRVLVLGEASPQAKAPNCSFSK